MNEKREDNYSLGMKASLITIIGNVILTILKLGAGILGKSSAMLADGAHTLSDVLSTIAVMVGLKISSKKADESHPYGHERFELIVSKILGALLIFTGVGIGINSIKIIISGDIVAPGRIALVAALISIVVKELMYRYTMGIAKEIRSLAMEADAWHHRSDALSSIGTFIGILGARLGLPILDPLAGIVVSILVIKVGLDIYMESIKGLVDESADEETIKDIERIVMENDEVKNISELKTRVFANQIYVDIDIEVDGCQTVFEGHDIAREIHDLIEEKVEDVKHVMVHVEPYQDEFNCEIRYERDDF